MNTNKIQKIKDTETKQRAFVISCMSGWFQFCFEGMKHKNNDRIRGWLLYAYKFTHIHTCEHCC